MSKIQKAKDKRQKTKTKTKEMYKYLPRWASLLARASIFETCNKNFSQRICSYMHMYKTLPEDWSQIWLPGGFLVLQKKSAQYCRNHSGNAWIVQFRGTVVTIWGWAGWSGWPGWPGWWVQLEALDWARTHVPSCCTCNFKMLTELKHTFLLSK